MQNHELSHDIVAEIDLPTSICEVATVVDTSLSSIHDLALRVRSYIHPSISLKHKSLKASRNDSLSSWLRKLASRINDKP